MFKIVPWGRKIELPKLSPQQRWILHVPANGERPRHDAIPLPGQEFTSSCLGMRSRVFFARWMSPSSDWGEWKMGQYVPQTMTACTD